MSQIEPVITRFCWRIITF